MKKLDKWEENNESERAVQRTRNNLLTPRCASLTPRLTPRDPHPAGASGSITDRPIADLKSEAESLRKQLLDMDVQNEIDIVANTKSEWEAHKARRRDQRKQKEAEWDHTKEAARQAWLSRKSAADFALRCEKTLMTQRQREHEQHWRKKKIQDAKMVENVEQQRRERWNSLQRKGAVSPRQTSAESRAPLSPSKEANASA